MDKMDLEKLTMKDEDYDTLKYDFRVINQEIYSLDLPREKGKRYKILGAFFSSKEISPKNLKDYLISDEDARVEFRVLENRDSGVINANFLIPLSFRYSNNDKIAHRKIGLYLNQSNEVTVDEYNLIQNILEQMNIILSKMIPELTVTIKELSRLFNEKSSEMVKFQLFSKNVDIEIPLRYESDGIKKIISILGSFAVVYNNPNYCLVVDELDTGIFEYLLGEI